MIETQNSVHSTGGTYLSPSSPVKHAYSNSATSHEKHDSSASLQPIKPIWKKPSSEDNLQISAAYGGAVAHTNPIRPNRRRDGDEDRRRADRSDGPGLTEMNVTQHNIKLSRVNPMVHQFTSPIGASICSLWMISAEPT
jgi:hypothetical protein